MTGFRNILIFGKIFNNGSINVIGAQTRRSDVFCSLKSVRSYKISNNDSFRSRTPAKQNSIKCSVPEGFQHAWKPIAFTIAFSSASLGAAAIWQYENARRQTRTLFRAPGRWINSEPQVQRLGKFRQECNRVWNNLTEGEKVFAPICFANVLVFIAWQIPSLQNTMLTYFASNAFSSRVCWPLVLSTFSHYSSIHLLANMFVLHSFCQGAVASLGKEQFVGFYLTAGCVSSLVSLLFRSAAGMRKPSVGASGAIMAVLAYVCSAYPYSELSVIFLPFLRFEAHLGIKALMALDTAGLIFRWQYFDHAAHLGGALIGIAWYHFGTEYIWKKRNIIVQVWHDLRMKFAK